MNNFLKASLVLLSIHYVLSKATPDDGCWRACPHIYDPVCGMDDENSTQVFGNDCIMETHNVCFETAYKIVDISNCVELEDSETLAYFDD
ncbi:hypothetical protein PVAND_000872 [Polypedilum vanderplanki]|uniref:Kazal-like domain-containing protein n=1 Tax=Polypedilum vanderplanki TaxID=319348 RepID=A0A9J6BLM6_POLVA|nr:hypothetical protein PVAND_000872 [Polypedilum vanderplanki]